MRDTSIGNAVTDAWFEHRSDRSSSMVGPDIDIANAIGAFGAVYKATKLWVAARQFRFGYSAALQSTGFVTGAEIAMASGLTGIPAVLAGLTGAVGGEVTAKLSEKQVEKLADIAAHNLKQVLARPQAPTERSLDRTPAVEVVRASVEQGIPPVESSRVDEYFAQLQKIQTTLNDQLLFLAENELGPSTEQPLIPPATAVLPSANGEITIETALQMTTYLALIDDAQLGMGISLPEYDAALTWAQRRLAVVAQWATGRSKETGPSHEWQNPAIKTPDSATDDKEGL